MEVSALRYSGGAGTHGRAHLLKLQSDERLVAMIRRGNVGAFEVLVSRYQTRLLAFCRHLLNSREDAEDVLQEVLTASYNAMLADNRPINVRPWLYRIARNRCLNHMRKATAVGVDSMDIHFSDHGATTADKVHEREEFRQLVGDIGQLPETQRTALVLREMDALSYDQIAEAMDTTVSSVKSLLVRARISLAEAAESRTITCEQVRDELGEVSEGILPRVSPPVRRHMKACERCAGFQAQLKHNNKALAALWPVGLLAAFRGLIVAHLGHSAASGAAGTAGAGTAGAGAAGGAATAAGAGAAAGAAATTGGGGFLTAGLGALATKAAAGIAVAAAVTAGTVAATNTHHATTNDPAAAARLTQSVSAGGAQAAAAAPKIAVPIAKTGGPGGSGGSGTAGVAGGRQRGHHAAKQKVVSTTTTTTTTTPIAPPVTTTTPAVTTPPTTTDPTTTTTTTTTGTTTTTSSTTTLPTVAAPPITVGITSTTAGGATATPAGGSSSSH